MSLHRVVARMFAELILHPEFSFVANSLYFNDFFRPGQRLVGTFQGVPVFVSGSDTSEPATAQEIARVLINPDWLDQSKTIIYDARRRRGVGIRVEAWRGGRWYQVFIPIKAAARNNERILGILETARAPRAA